jgi:hypothetical protein
MEEVSLSRAAAQAGWTKAGAETTAYWWKICIRSRMGASARHQPKRQPVMA